MAANLTAITAILHTHDDELRIARAVESLRCCEEILVVDSASTDDTCRIARAFGARVIAAPRVAQGENALPLEVSSDWIFSVSPGEAVSEALEASLLEWKLERRLVPAAFGVTILEEIQSGWALRPAEARLTHRDHGGEPLEAAHMNVAANINVLAGCLLRLILP